MTTQPAWYETAFGRDYLAVYPHRDLATARIEVRGLIERGVGGRVLDLGCGFGRHALALREAGLEVWGLDRSFDLLRLADPSVGGRLVRADFRALPFRSESFDVVTMLFSSFGYFEDRDNELTMAELARVLEPGGVAVIDLMNAARIRRTLVPESTTRRGSMEIHECRRLERGDQRVVKEVHITRGDGSESRWREDVRLYGESEFEALLASVGLLRERVEGDFDGSRFQPESPRQIVWARKTPRAGLDRGS